MKEISITSFDNLQIGQAENAAAGTGCTVFLLGKDGAPAGLDVRGGGPASRESELLKPLAAAQVIHAIVLAGGSAFGLDAAGGVMRYLEERGIGFDVGAVSYTHLDVYKRQSMGLCPTFDMNTRYRWLRLTPTALAISSTEISPDGFFPDNLLPSYSSNVCSVLYFQYQ